MLSSLKVLSASYQERETQTCRTVDTPNLSATSFILISSPSTRSITISDLCCRLRIDSNKRNLIDVLQDNSNIVGISPLCLHVVTYHLLIFPLLPAPFDTSSVLRCIFAFLSQLATAQWVYIHRWPYLVLQESIQIIYFESTSPFSR